MAHFENKALAEKREIDHEAALPMNLKFDRIKSEEAVGLLRVAGEAEAAERRLKDKRFAEMIKEGRLEDHIMLVDGVSEDLAIAIVKHLRKNKINEISINF